MRKEQRIGLTSCRRANTVGVVHWKPPHNYRRGGEHVGPELRGRVLEMVRVTGVFGETKAFVRDPDLLARLGLLNNRCEFEISAERIGKVHLTRSPALGLEHGRGRYKNADAFRARGCHV